ncbi:protein phosphatase [Pullulanibacillus pueri]|uniref:protein-serine/threonine phosphatase n=1 Tax=Pullulanibacillus pueri TaxID=1437324 RepID=A0A8J2ZS89_9BACL|nr:Stp1/IreP family PP2C-type Ser/Thr phosphatase [Pullulanibacillus pueri]MBM7680183.1 protein phosphatase [Pullulanibacillus pueri]GGH74775.1 protein phosphatase [Pullulanibacillus pueri]
MKTIFKTDCGKLRDHNEDNGGIFTREGRTLALVVDGMGGHNAGDVASALALKVVATEWDSHPELQESHQVITWLENTVALANKKIYEKAQSEEACKGMGTTLVAAFCDDTQVIVANIGDSRCYFLPEQGEIIQVTEDDSLVNELVKAGQLSKEDADDHPKKNVITKAIGTMPQVECEIQQLSWSKGDRLLLCSDGLSNLVNENDLSHILRNTLSMEEKAEELVRLANEAGGDDNITLTIVEHGGDDGESK